MGKSPNRSPGEGLMDVAQSNFSLKFLKTQTGQSVWSSKPLSSITHYKVTNIILIE